VLRSPQEPGGGLSERAETCPVARRSTGADHVRGLLGALAFGHEAAVAEDAAEFGPITDRAGWVGPVFTGVVEVGGDRLCGLRRGRLEAVGVDQTGD
jgi:hypothetical protein